MLRVVISLGVDGLRASSRQVQRLVLSCEPTLLMRWLIPRWPQFQAQQPGIDVHLVAGGGPLSFATGIGLAIRRDDLHSGLLVAPLGFVEDGSRYCLLSPQPLPSDGPPADLLEWLQRMV